MTTGTTTRRVVSFRVSDMRELIGDFLARFQPVTRGEENKAKDLLAIGRK